MTRSRFRALRIFFYILKETGTADAIVDQAIAVNPNLAEACRLRGFVSSHAGRHDVAIEQFQYAMRLNPLDPQTCIAEHGLAVANFHLRRFDIALSWATKSMARQKNYAPPVRFAMMCYALLGRIDDAHVMRARVSLVRT